MRIILWQSSLLSQPTSKRKHHFKVLNQSGYGLVIEDIVMYNKLWFDMEFESDRFDMIYFRYRYFDMICYDNSIFNISASIFSIFAVDRHHSISHSSIQGQTMRAQARKLIA